MKHIFIIIISCFIASANGATTQTLNPNYDAELAASLGADDYGMKSYVLVVLKSGSNKSENKEEKSKAFTGHFTNMNRLVAEKKLTVAGPFGQNDNDFRGLFILDVTTLAEAKKILETDPAIKANFLSTELYKWYGSAALATYLQASDKVWKHKP